jgi:hypothetical protein
MSAPQQVRSSLTRGRPTQLGRQTLLNDGFYCIVIIMKFSVQNDAGKVYGIGELPKTPASIDVWHGELEVALKDILGINGVRAATLHSGAEEFDRVVIDLTANVSDSVQEERLDRVDQAIASIAYRLSGGESV